MKKYFEYTDDKSAKFWEITLSDATLKTRYGKIGASGQSTEKSFPDSNAAAKEYTKLIKEKTAKGYTEILAEPTVKPLQNSGKNTPHYIIEYFQEATEKYSISFLDYWVENQFDQQKILVVTTDAHFEALELEAFAQNNKVNAILFCKDLSVDSYLYQKTSDFGPLLIVLGDVKAKNLYLRGSDVYFRGKVKVLQTFVPGDYNHGSITIKGSIEAGLILGSDDHSFNYDAKKIKNSIVVGLDAGSEATLKVYDAQEILDAKYFDDEDSDWWDRDLVLESIKSGTSLLQEKLDISKLKTVQQKNAEKLAQERAFQQQDTIKEIVKNKKSKNPILDLSRQNLIEFPLAITELLHLKELYIGSSAGLQSLPAELSNLQQLKHLGISYCGLTQFPPAITSLKAIESINIGGNAISDLPKELAFLKNIKHINCQGTQITHFPGVFFELPYLEEVSFFGMSGSVNYTINKPLPRIKSLDFSYASTMPRITVKLPTLETLLLSIDTNEPIPNPVFECQNLKRLEIVNCHELVKKLPEKIVRLQNLEEIAFSVANSSNIELLAQLPKLRKITIHLENLHENFKKILALPQWTEIDICGIDMLNYHEFHADLWPPILTRKNLKKIFFSNEEWDIKRTKKYYKL